MSLSPRGALRGKAVALASGMGQQRIRTPPLSVQGSVRQPHQTFPNNFLPLFGLLPSAEVVSTTHLRYQSLPLDKLMSFKLSKLYSQGRGHE